MCPTETIIVTSLDNGRPIYVQTSQLKLMQLIGGIIAIGTTSNWYNQIHCSYISKDFDTEFN